MLSQEKSFVSKTFCEWPSSSMVESKGDCFLSTYFQGDARRALMIVKKRVFGR
jgi:hypothetical protein